MGVARGLSADVGNRLTCYCDDCQSFAWFLSTRGGPAVGSILDAHGGTEIFQLSPARLEFRDSRGELACVRLTPRGLLRWYARCCRTPVGNTSPSQKLPFVGLIHSCLGDAPDGHSRDEVLGPIGAGVHARFARGDRTALDAHDRASAQLLARFAKIVAGARLRRDQRRSPFFDAESGVPVATPQVLTSAELREVEAARDASD